MFFRDRTSAEVAAQPFELLALLGFRPLYGAFLGTFGHDALRTHWFGHFACKKAHLAAFLDNPDDKAAERQKACANDSPI